MATSFTKLYNEYKAINNDLGTLFPTHKRNLKAVTNNKPSKLKITTPTLNTKHRRKLQTPKKDDSSSDSSNKDTVKKEKSDSDNSSSKDKDSNSNKDDNSNNKDDGSSNKDDGSNNNYNGNDDNSNGDDENNSDENNEDDQEEKPLDLSESHNWTRWPIGIYMILISLPLGFKGLEWFTPWLSIPLGLLCGFEVNHRIYAASAQYNPEVSTGAGWIALWVILGIVLATLFAVSFWIWRRFGAALLSAYVSMLFGGLVCAIVNSIMTHQMEKWIGLVIVLIMFIVGFV